MTYPKPEFPIGHTHRNRLGETLTIVGRERTDLILVGGRRLFSDEDSRRMAWFYTLRDSSGTETSISEGGLRHEVQAEASRRTPRPTDRPVCPSQRGRQSAGTRIRSPLGEWTVVRSWYVYMKEQNRERCRYLLLHEDGHEEEWWSFDMADADFHVIQAPKRQTLDSA
ncbi:hypothetical protein ACFYWD_20610 [Streptomyces sp. NPDC003781]|uniref:hypothetical protein n=1 Tax=Streptomyces sp. NPDC003781 TaxID=3364686 RepID=UPI0036B0CCA7